MTIHDLRNSDGNVFAFEVSNFLLSRRACCRIVRRIPGAHLLNQPPFFSWPWSSEDEFCEFELDAVKFVVWEPWGDSSRYWIGPQPLRWVPEITWVREAFARSGPFGLRSRANGKAIRKVE